MTPVIDHIQITVRNMEVAVPFYDRMMALLGFDVGRKVGARLERYDMHVVEYLHPQLAIAISSPRKAFADETIHRRKPGALHHLTFRAESRAEVDRLHRELVTIGAEIVGGPKLWPEHGAGYYAVFFKDPEGIKYEIVYSAHPHLT
ncbi:MAG TPA: VOC family protein [Candidatus Kapabacteria bacterium]|nr:VOC family protein [Candidatus Kapabacteria bacterium]